MKEIAKRLDLKDWENFGGQALRALMATKLGDDASVNISESMAALRHNSAPAHKHYNKTSGTNETCKYKAFVSLKNSNIVFIFLTFHSFSAFALNFEISK